MRVAITGATGFIGTRLIGRLQREGMSIRILGRRDPEISGVEFVEWTLANEPAASAFEDVDAVVHLAGEPLAQRWSDEVKRRIRESRVQGTQSLVRAIGKLASRPSVLIGASAIGYYGDRGDEVLNENSGSGHDFLAQVCIEWERESRRAEDLGVRVTLLRTGVVLGRDGGALQQMLPPFKAGVGGPVGSGEQWVSWIHIDDLTSLIAFALRQPRLSGPLNGTSPNPVRNSGFAKSLGSALHRPSLVPVPAFGLRLMFGEMATVVLGSQRVLPEAALKAGYSFEYPELLPALQQILAT